MVDDDDGDESPSPEPRTDSRSALPRGFRAWRRLRIVKRDESFSLIFFSPKVNMELELRLVERQGAHVMGNVVISKNFLRTRKIMVMHSNVRGECHPRTLVDC